MENVHPAGAPPRLRRVFLRDMVLLASVGVHAHEHEARQRLRINLDLAVLDDFAATDVAVAPSLTLEQELSQVVDYERVAAHVRDIVNAGHIRLVETLAERLARSCLLDRRVVTVRVRVEKLDIFTDIDSVGVEIERGAEGAHKG